MGLRQEIFDDAIGVEGLHVVETPMQLSSRQKAAVIVRLLLSQDVKPGLDRLTPDTQADLARAMASLGPISRATLADVVRDFTTRLDGLALTAPRNLAGALALLEPHLSPIARDGLRAEAAANDPADTWARIAATEANLLRPLLQSESAEVAAILLSKLGAAKAAALLSDLPEERAQVIAHAVSLTATVTPAMVERIGAHLAEQLQGVGETAFRSSPVDRVGAILNAVNGALRENLLGGLEARDAVFAGEVRRSIFTFQHIPRRIQPVDVPRILRRVDPVVMTRAIAAGAEEAPLAVEFLLENMSKRLAEQMRDDAAAMTKPRPEEGEAAMAEVVSAIRALEEEGEISLIAPED